MKKSPFPGELLRTYRIRRGLTQRKLGALAGVSGNYIVMLEGGGRGNPSLEVLQRIADVLSVTEHERAAMVSAEDIPPKSALSQDAPVGAHLALNRLMTRDSGVSEFKHELDTLLSHLLNSQGESSGPSRRTGRTTRSRPADWGYAKKRMPAGMPHSSASVRSKARRRGELARRLSRIITLFADESLAIEARLDVARELISQVEWRFSNKNQQETRLIKPKAKGKRRR